MQHPEFIRQGQLMVQDKRGAGEMDRACYRGIGPARACYRGIGPARACYRAIGPASEIAVMTVHVMIM